VSQTFASALWALDTLFELARAGVRGVNVHTFPGAGYELFRVRRDGGRWSATVSPEYYGLLMFALAAPAGSRLLADPGEQPGPLKVWATLAPDRRIRVAIINKSPDQDGSVLVRTSGSAAGSATLARLEAPNLTATGAVTLAGRSFGATTSTGRLAGTPQADELRPSGGGYNVDVPAGSAALLTLPAGSYGP
jgi:hypothetical protein